jgi:hypothetical protein
MSRDKFIFFPTPCQFFSKPNIRHFAPIPRQVFETVKAFKALEGHAGYIAGFGEAQIDRYSRAAIFSRPGAPPANQIAADAAKVEGKRSGAPDIGGESAFRGCDMNAMAFVVIGPKSAVTAASGAVADRGIGDFTMKGPLDRSAMAMTLRDLLRNFFFPDSQPRLHYYLKFFKVLQIAILCDQQIPDRNQGS